MNEPVSLFLPPPELVRQWTQYNGDDDAERFWMRIATQAAQWGADTELNYCCDELSFWGSKGMAERLRSDRRPRPLSLKEQALNAMSHADKDALTNPLTGEVVALRTILSKEQSDTIRLALEALDA